MSEVRLKTVKEVCDAARLSKSMVYKLLAEGILRRVRLPYCSKVLIAEDEVRQYIAAGMKAAAAG